MRSTEDRSSKPEKHVEITQKKKIKRILTQCSNNFTGQMGRILVTKLVYTLRNTKTVWLSNQYKTDIQDMRKLAEILILFILTELMLYHECMNYKRKIFSRLPYAKTFMVHSDVAR